MIHRDAGWAALAATLYGLCCWHLVWGAWPVSQVPDASVVARIDDQRQAQQRPSQPLLKEP
jgi:hypothetical protein